MRKGHLLFSAISLFLISHSSAALSQSSGLEDMVGARAGQAENGLHSRGWSFIRAEPGDDRSYAYWWHATRRQCVTIATMDGRFSSITPSPAPDCRQPATRLMPSPPLYRPTPPAYGRPGYDPGGTVIDGRPINIALVCFGDGRRDGLASGTTWTWNRDRDRYEYGTYTQSRPEMFDAALTIQLWDGGGRIRLPKSLVPPLNSRGNNGWWDLTNVQVSRDMITASYRLNGLNKPRVTIDRRAGRITVQGFSDYGFRGTCDPADDDRRRF